MSSEPEKKTPVPWTSIVVLVISLFAIVGFALHMKDMKPPPPKPPATATH